MEEGNRSKLPCVDTTLSRPCVSTDDVYTHTGCDSGCKLQRTYIRRQRIHWIPVGYRGTKCEKFFSDAEVDTMLRAIEPESTRGEKTSSAAADARDVQALPDEEVPDAIVSAYLAWQSSETPIEAFRQQVISAGYLEERVDGWLTILKDKMIS